MIKQNTEEAWLSVDEATDVVASLAHFQRCRNLINEDSTAWKWAIISLHNALQGSMTCHLAGTANLGCLSNKSASQWLEWNDKNRRGEIGWVHSPADEFGIVGRRPASKKDRVPRQYLANAKDMFDRLHKENLRVEAGCGAVLPITLSQRGSFQILNNLRNQFTHFTPMGWSIEVSGLPTIFGDMLEVIRMIAADPWPFQHLDEANQKQLGQLLKHLTKA